MTLNNLLLQYEYQKLKGGYEPNCTNEEIIDFLYFYEQFNEIESTNINFKTEALLKKILPIKKLKSNEDFLIVPTNEFTDADINYLENISFKQRREIENTINNYLRSLPKREVKDDIYTRKEVEFAENSAAMIIKFIWDNYINSYIEEAKWPIQCRDINRYLLENDLADLIDVPSIRNLLLKFYHETVEKILTIRRENHNFKISRISDSLLAKANSEFLTKGYEELFKYTGKRTFEIEGKNGLFIDRAYADGIYNNDDIFERDITMRKEPIGTAKTKKIIETINNL